MTNNLTYTLCGDYYIPNLSLFATDSKPLGKYGRMRKTYLKEHRPILWNAMILSETLYPHLYEIDAIAHRRVEHLITEILSANTAPDKATQQMAWVRHMNMLKRKLKKLC